MKFKSEVENENENKNKINVNIDEYLIDDFKTTCSFKK